MDAKELDLLTICKGGVPDLFAHEAAKIAANIADPNTKATATRKITLEFTIKPFPDRSGANIIPDCTVKLASLDASSLSSTVYLAKRDGKYRMFTRDLRQEMLFSGEEEVFPATPPVVEVKTENAGGQ